MCVYTHQSGRSCNAAVYLFIPLGSVNIPLVGKPMRCEIMHLRFAQRIFTGFARKTPVVQDGDVSADGEAVLTPAFDFNAESATARCTCE